LSLIANECTQWLQVKRDLVIVKRDLVSVKRDLVSVKDDSAAMLGSMISISYEEEDTCTSVVVI
jgi:hypothetical protein